MYGWWYLIGIAVVVVLWATVVSLERRYHKKRLELVRNRLAKLEASRNKKDQAGSERNEEDNRT